MIAPGALHGMGALQGVGVGECTPRLAAEYKIRGLYTAKPCKRGCQSNISC